MYSIEQKLQTTVNKLDDLIVSDKQPIHVEYTDEVADRHVLPIKQTNWKSFDKPYCLFEQESTIGSGRSLPFPSWTTVTRHIWQ